MISDIEPRIQFVVYPPPQPPLTPSDFNSWAHSLFEPWKLTEADWCSHVSEFVAWLFDNNFAHDHLDMPGKPSISYLVIHDYCITCGAEVELDHPFTNGRMKCGLPYCRACRQSRWKYVPIPPPPPKKVKPKSTKPKLKKKSTIEQHPLFTSIAEYDNYYSFDPMDDPYYKEQEKQRHIAAIEQM